MNRSIGFKVELRDGLRRFSVLGMLLVLVTIVVLGHIGRYRMFSPIDELQHFDYLLKAPVLEFPGSGDRVGQEAARAETCSRLDAPFDSALPSCVTAPDEVNVAELQEQGYNTAYIHPPGYYFVNGGLTRALDAITFHKVGLLTLARIAGLIWAWLAVVLLWLVFKEFGASTRVAAVGIVLVVTSGTVISAASTVNPDGSAVAIGAGILWAAARWERTKRYGWLVVLFAVFAMITKFSNLAGVAVALIFLLGPAVRLILRNLRNGESRPLRAVAENKARLLIGGISIVAIGIVSICWRFIQSILQVLPANELPMAQPTVIASFPWTAAVNSWRVGVSPVQSPWMAPFMNSAWMTSVVGIVDLALVVGVVGGLILSPAGSKGRRVASATIWCSLLLGPFLVAFLYVVQHVNFAVPPRYGLSLIAGLAVSAIPLLQMKWGFRLGLGLSVATTAVVLSAIASPVL